MKTLLLCIVVTMSNTCILSQFLCYTESDTISHTYSYSTECGISSNYTPIVSEQTPIVTVRIAFHIFQKDDGSANFQNTITDKNYLNNIIISANNRLSNLGVLNIGSTPYIQDSRIRLKLEKIYFHPHDEDAFFNVATSSTQYSKYVSNDFDNYGMTNDDKINVEHIFLRGEDSTTGGGRKVGGRGNQGHIVEKGFYKHYLDYGFNSSHWGPVANLIHELGHSFSCKHNFHDGPNGLQCDDCNDNDPIDLSCPIEATSNNYMDYFPGGYNSLNPDPGFSQCQLSKMHYYLNGNAGTIWRTVLKDYCTYTSSEIIEINTGIYEWKSHKRLKGDLVINQGATLIIKCKVHMPESSRVIIKPGGKLIVDGGIITNECGDFWLGIEVWGTSNQHQYPSSNPTYQGLLVVKNGGIIENAHVGATNWHVDSWNEIGGVIQAEDGVFRNNRRDVVFVTYQNFSHLNPSVLLPNSSYFKNTTFETNDDFIEKGLAIQNHVSLWDVDGVNFINCHFSNGISAIKNNSSAPNKGIYSMDAGYKVLAGCSTTPPFGQPCPTANLLKSSFTGFNTAIEATGASTSNTVTIQQTEFIDNIRGVVIDEFDNVSVNRNDLDIGDAGYTLWIPFGNGITIENSTGYIVEENTVNTALTSGYYSGINTTDSGPDNNRIYKNTLSNLTYGVSGNGVNHNSNYQTGLQFLCNEFQGNGTAISLNSTPTTDGIRFYQGDYSPAKSAGNTFVSNSVSIDNNANSIVYMHNGGATQPTNNQGLITLQYTANSNSCPSSFGWIISKFSSPLAIDSLNAEIVNLSMSYNDLNFAYNSLIDNGNTEAFKENIEINWSSDAWLLRSKLLEKSPYLSSDALLKAASQQVLPNGMLLEILLANPEATKGEEFIENLKVATQNTFPEYMLDYVRNNWDNRTTRAAMESQLASISFELSTTMNGVKYLTKSKEEYSDNDRLEIAKLGDELYHKVGLMDFYIEHSEFAKADSVLNEIETTKKFQESLSLIENFDDYIAFRSGLGTKNLAQLDSSEIVYLQTLADNNGRVAGYAQNILCFFYDMCYEKESPLIPNQQKSMEFPTNNTNNTTPELNNILYEVAVYPNPAGGYTSIAWEIYDELNNAQYRVVDLNGREMLQGELKNNKGEKVIDTRNLKNGVYIIGVYNNDQLKKNIKLIVNNGK